MRKKAVDETTLMILTHVVFPGGGSGMRESRGTAVLNAALQVQVTSPVMANPAHRDEPAILSSLAEKKLIIDALLLGTNFTNE